MGEDRGAPDILPGMRLITALVATDVDDDDPKNSCSRFRNAFTKMQRRPGVGLERNWFLLGPATPMGRNGQLMFIVTTRRDANPLCEIMGPRTQHRYFPPSVQCENRQSLQRGSILLQASRARGLGVACALDETAGSDGGQTSKRLIAALALGSRKPRPARFKRLDGPALVAYH